eukprot:31332_1
MSASRLPIVCGAALASLVIYKTLSKLSESSEPCTTKNKTQYLYISGDRSQVGKSSICVAIIQSLIDTNVLKPSEIAYIKPMTQCIKPTDIARYCLMNGIDCAPIGPIVFKKGYTSEVIDGLHGTRSHRLQLIKTQIEKIATNKKLVIIDGVGYVSVGSVTQIDNVDVAKMMNAFTILIVRSGIGDSIDTTNLLLSYYQIKDSAYFKDKFLGVIYNFKESNSRHTVGNAKRYLTKYFNENRPHLKLLGWLPPLTKDTVEVPSDVMGCMRINKPETIDWQSWSKLHHTEVEWLTTFAKSFQNNIDMDFILSKLKL